MFVKALFLHVSEGKLYQIEYSFKAIRLPGDTTIGVRGKDTVCLITTKKVPDKLVDPTSVSRMYRITPSIGCCVTGRLPDARALIYKSRQIAAEFQFDNGYQIPVKHLANELANYNQLFTQHAYKRVPGVSLLFSAIDDEIGPSLVSILALILITSHNRKICHYKQTNNKDYIWLIQLDHVMDIMQYQLVQKNKKE